MMKRVYRTQWGGMLVGLILSIVPATTAHAGLQAQPDVTVTAIAFSPEAPKPLELTEIQATVNNVGQAPATSFRVALSVDGRFANAQTIESLDPGASATVTFTWFGREGERVVRVEANPFGDLEETSTDNNTLEIAIAVLADPLPDLVVDDIRTVPEHPKPGETAILEVSVRNVGLIAPTSRAALIVKDGARTLRTLFVDPLGAQERATFQVAWRPSQGEAFLNIEIDALERIEEIDELNNLFTRVLNISTRPATGANLTVSELTLTPADAAPGETVTVTATIVNTGQGLADSFSVRFEADGQTLGAVSVVQLPPGAQTQVSANWRVSAAGERLVRVKADEHAVVIETDEEDNALARLFEIGPALSRCGQAIHLQLDDAAVIVLSGLLSLTVEQVHHVFMAKVKHEMERDYEGLNVRFNLDEPENVHSTLRFIGEAQADRLGEAPVDGGNVFKNDVGKVFIGSFEAVLARSANRSLESLAVLIANTASHEAGHFLGLRHDDQQTTWSFGGQNMMADGRDAPATSLFTDAFFTEENVGYLEGVLPLDCG